MKKHFVLALLLNFILISPHLNGQSFFSMKALGEECLVHDARALSLGSISLSNENPAYPLSLKRTELIGTITTLWVWAKDSQYQRLISDARPYFFSGKVPLPYKFRVGLKLSEEFNQNFEVYSETIPQGNYLAQRSIKGQGGVYALGINLSRSFFSDRLSLGIEYARLLGEAFENWRFTIFNSAYQNSDTVFLYYSGHKLRVGLAAFLKSFTLGVVIEDLFDLNVDQRIVSNNSLVSFTEDIKIYLPKSYGLAFKYSHERVLIGVDFFLRTWQPVTINNVPFDFRKSLRLSGGGGYRLTENLTLRTAMHYYRSYLKDHTQTPINEYGITLGTDTPIKNFGAISYSLGFYRRGGKIIKENILRFNLTLTYEELWQKRTRRWGS